MKNRLRGLLALMLCFILTVAPISGAMAADNIYYEENYSDEPSFAQEGDLISSGVYLGVGSGGILYYDGLYNEEIRKEDKVKDKDTDQQVNEIQESSTYEKDLWAAAKIEEIEEYPFISLERVNKFAIEPKDIGNNRLLIIMNDLQTIDSVNKSVEDRRIALEDAAKTWEILVFYQMGVYANNTPVEGVMRRVEYDGSAINISLPYPDQTIAENWEKYDFALFHMNSNAGIEQIECTPSENGISFSASSFSPYALAYKLKADDGNGGDEDGGDNNDDGNGEGGSDGDIGGGNDGNGNNDQSAATALPKTGDSSNLMLWIALSIMALAGVLYIARRRENA